MKYHSYDNVPYSTMCEFQISDGVWKVSVQSAILRNSGKEFYIEIPANACCANKTLAVASVVKV